MPAVLIDCGETVVSPCARIAASEAVAEPSVSAAVGAGAATRPPAASSRMPVGWPSAPLMTLPLTGSGVAAVIFASASAREFSSCVWPSVDITTIGRLVLSASRSVLLTCVPDGCIAWRYQLVTMR